MKHVHLQTCVVEIVKLNYLIQIKIIYSTYKGKTLTMTELPVPSEKPTSVFGVCIFRHAYRSVQ